MKGTVIENERETAEIAAVTSSERGGVAAPESAGGDPEAVKRTIGSVAEKGVETRTKIRTRTRTKIRTKIRTRIKIRTRTKTETANAGVAVGTGSVIETVTGKRRKREQREKLQKMLRLILKKYKWVMVLWMEQRSSQNQKKRVGTVRETGIGIRTGIKRETGIETGDVAIETGIGIRIEIETEIGGEIETERGIEITSGIETGVTAVRSERREFLTMV